MVLGQGCIQVTIQVLPFVGNNYHITYHEKDGDARSIFEIRVARY